MLVSSREYQSWKEAQDPSGSPAFRKCLSFLICRKGKGRQEVSCHQAQSPAALTLPVASAAPLLSQTPPPNPETKVRFLKPDPQARIQWRFQFYSIPLGQREPDKKIPIAPRPRSSHPPPNPPTPAPHADLVEQERSRTTVPPLGSKSEAAVTHTQGRKQRVTLGAWQGWFLAN